jgi:peptidoglycan-N-acetylglucosamine deacetylase
MKPLPAFAAALILSLAPGLKAQTPFPWPEGKRVAVSLSFDDARASQVVNGLDLFERHGARVTFYVNPRNMEPRLEGWKRAVALGHEIGNHSDTHPCSGNFPFSRKNNLEEYTAARMEQDIEAANRGIQRVLGVSAVTFAYPCGSKFIGRGEQTRSTVPLVAKRFLAGRGFKDEAANDPAFCDLAQLLGVDSDGMPFEAMRERVKQAEERGAWLVFAGHNIGAPGNQTTETAALESLLRYAKDPANGVWLDTVETIAKYVKKHRTAP